MAAFAAPAPLAGLPSTYGRAKMRRFSVAMALTLVGVSALGAQEPIWYAVDLANAPHHEARITVTFPELDEGTLELTWNGRDAEGAALPAGVYFVRAEVDGVVSTQRVTFLR